MLGACHTHDDILAQEVSDEVAFLIIMASGPLPPFRVLLLWVPPAVVGVALMGMAETLGVATAAAEGVAPAAPAVELLWRL